MCGCSATTNGQCINCNSSYFIGYDNPTGIQVYYYSSSSISSSSLPTTAPSTNGASCSITTEYTDVSTIGNRFLFS